MKPIVSFAASKDLPIEDRDLEMYTATAEPI